MVLFDLNCECSNFFPHCLCLVGHSLTPPLMGKESSGDLQKAVRGFVSISVSKFIPSLILGPFLLS